MVIGPAFLATAATKRLLFNTALSLVASAGTSMLNDRKDEKSNTQKAGEIGVSTAVGTAAAAIIGPKASIAARLIAGIGTSATTNALVGSTPASDALEASADLARAYNPFDSNGESAAQQYARLQKQRANAKKKKRNN